MKESEAIEAMQFDLKVGGEIHSQVLRDAVDIAIQVLEKQIPNKPIDRCMYKECPTCGNVEIEFCKHCPDCGQQLDWSDENERS